MPSFLASCAAPHSIDREKALPWLSAIISIVVSGLTRLSVAPAAAHPASAPASASAAAAPAGTRQLTVCPGMLPSRPPDPDEPPICAIYRDDRSGELPSAAESRKCSAVVLRRGPRIVLDNFQACFPPRSGRGGKHEADFRRCLFYIPVAFSLCPERPAGTFWS